ncbi:3-hydroxyacyl-CoA dehydrogenase [Paracoccus sp. SCSIO 75233]|uniref:3-hydroxyacyl-CoA dehydrogenase n=1 Tax=Paracoccus sp. SCSIO 75233 TaxID=3017782 RepID=UPI0022F0FBBB|nr:3-hydroxyacyl-CoA dehydrogenase [Paracoccus sp. SCSIO 75233]WBU52327.1 3-hydroxyacyl-CoA dehydrogenase [Paracoccus sp. SCSIO 75233]
MSVVESLVVAGAGVMGSQVAWQAAWHGKTVVVYDAFEEGLKRSETFFSSYGDEFVKERGASREEVEAAMARITRTTDLEAALADADLVIEQVPENLKIKQEFWQNASRLAPEKTIFCTNTSSLLPSMMLDFVDRPKKFLTLHFCVKVWEANIGEVMLTPQTDPAMRETVSEFAREIGLVPIQIEKEQPGYILNSLLIPFMRAAIELVRTGVGSHQDVDRVWRICMGGTGPIEMLDKVGMQVAYHLLEGLAEMGDPTAKEQAEFVKTEFIDKGKLGIGSGAGFYNYPDPEFAREGFLEPDGKG